MVNAINLPPNFYFLISVIFNALFIQGHITKTECLSTVHHLKEILMCSIRNFPELCLVLDFIETSLQMHH